MLKAADLRQRWMKGVSAEFVLRKLREKTAPWRRAPHLDFRLTGTSRVPARAGNQPQATDGPLDTPKRGHIGPNFRRLLYPGDHGLADSAGRIVGVLVFSCFYSPAIPGRAL